MTLATDILTLDQEQFSTAFRKSPMKRAKLHGLQRNAEIVLGNAGVERARKKDRRDSRLSTPLASDDSSVAT